MTVLDQLDPDLAAIGEARDKAKRARRAFEAFEGTEQRKLDEIVTAMAKAGTAAAEKIARMVVEETGFGVYEDKIYKNLYNTEFVAKSMLPMRCVGVLWVDEANRVTAIGAPVGVIAGIIPVTNPSSTVFFKCLAAVKSGNAIVCAPHPRAAKSSAASVEVMAEAAIKAGAPADLVGCMTNVSVESTAELMRHPDVALIMATGGPGMVRAAYSSGKPTLAVGAGNVPVYIHRSVKDVREAALMAITSKSSGRVSTCCNAMSAMESFTRTAPPASAARMQASRAPRRSVWTRPSVRHTR